MHTTDRSMHTTDRSMYGLTRRPPHWNSDAISQAGTLGQAKPSYPQTRDAPDLRVFLETEEDILHFTLNESRRDAGLDVDLKPRSPRSGGSKVTKKNVDLMVSMGFSKPLVLIALGENGNNVDKAVNAIVNNRSTALINTRSNAAAAGRS